MVDWSVDESKGKEMKNLITDFGLVCANKFQIGLIGSMYFFGESLGSFVYTFFIVKS